jgi:hypothetical protein
MGLLYHKTVPPDTPFHFSAFVADVWYKVKKIVLNSLKTVIILNYIQRLNSYRSVNTLRLGYKYQLIKAV